MKRSDLWEWLRRSAGAAPPPPPFFCDRGLRRPRPRAGRAAGAGAKGAWVWDTNGRRYLDFNAGFGVASVGHANARVVRAVRRQAGRLLHGFGDVHPHEARARLAERVARLAPWPDARVLWA